MEVLTGSSHIGEHTAKPPIMAVRVRSKAESQMGQRERLFRGSYGKSGDALYAERIYGAFVENDELDE